MVAAESLFFDCSQPTFLSQICTGWNWPAASASSCCCWEFWRLCTSATTWRSCSATGDTLGATKPKTVKQQEVWDTERQSVKVRWRSSEGHVESEHFLEPVGVIDIEVKSDALSTVADWRQTSYNVSFKIHVQFVTFAWLIKICLLFLSSF